MHRVEKDRLYAAVPNPNPRGLKRDAAGGRPDLVGELDAQPIITVARQYRIPNR